jgi:hypothetical protein
VVPVGNTVGAARSAPAAPSAERGADEAAPRELTLICLPDRVGVLRAPS